MYIQKDRTGQRQIKFLCLEDLVPQDHLLRDIDRAIDFKFIYDEVKGLYGESVWGKPGIDPVCLFKIVFIQYIFGIRSMRQTIKEIEVNTAYRWFIGYDIGQVDAFLDELYSEMQALKAELEMLRAARQMNSDSKPKHGPEENSKTADEQ